MRSPARASRRRAAGATLLAAAALLLASGPAARAYWTAAPSQGTGSAAAATVQAASITVPATAVATVLVTWTTQARVVGAADAGPITYAVQRRTGASGWATLTTGGCAGLARPVSACTDTVTVNATYGYRVVATYAGAWTATSGVETVVATPDLAPTVADVSRAGPSPTAASTVRWTVTFSEPVTGVDPSDFAVVADGLTNGPVVTDVTGSGAAYVVTASTGAGSGSLALRVLDDDSVRDAAGQPVDGAGTSAGASAAAYVLDRTAPQLQALAMLDADADGRVDRVTATFDEPLAASAATAPWTLSNVPSGGTLATVAIQGATATLTLTPGTGAPATAVGTFRIALAASAGGVRDGLGNPSAFAAQAPLDRAGPVPVSLSSANAGLQVGKLEPADTMTLGFSEPLVAGSVPTAPTVTEARTGTANATLSVPGVVTDTDIGSRDYLTANGAAVSAGSTSVSGATLRVTVGACASGCSLLRGPSLLSSSPPYLVLLPPTVTVSPAGTITDAAANPATGSTAAALWMF